MNITATQLLAIMPNAKKRYDKFLPYINRYADKFEINTLMRMAHFLAQIAQESGELRYTQEIASGRAYEGRKDLGNTHKGDGVRFKGRGLMQITGRMNYRACGKYCGFDLENNPQMLEQPLWAVESAMWFFSVYKNLNSLADADDIENITKKINGGLNGFDERKLYLRRAKKALNIK